MNIWTIYEHISPSGKIYVGITSMKPEARWESGSGYKPCVLFYKAIQKYGWNNIQHIIIAAGLGEGTAKNMEKDLIAFNKAKGISYNITDGGDGALGRPCSALRKEMTRNIWKGKKIPKEIVAKFSVSLRGKKKSTEHIEKIRLGKIGNGNGNKRVHFIKDNAVVFKFPSCVEAARHFNVHPNNISRCARKEYKTFKGYVVTYERDMAMFHPNIILDVHVMEKNPYVQNETSKYVEILK